MTLLQQLPKHVIMRRFTSAGGQEHDRIVRSHRVQGVLACDFLTQVKPIPFAKQE